MNHQRPGSDHLGDLVGRAQSGDLSAFNVLVEQFQRQVFNLCYRTTGNAEDAADATQEAFLSAYRSLTTFRGSADGFSSWLLRIAVNACLDQGRKRRRRPAQSLDQYIEEHQGEPLELAQDVHAGPEARTLRAETVRQVEAGLQQLPTEQRLTVVLCDVQGLSYEQAAEVLGVELGTVKSRLSRGRAALREHLVSNGELPTVARRLD